MTLFWHKTGPLVRYDEGSLQIEDLNPEISTRWRMSRWELLKFGVKTCLAAVRP